MLLEIKITTAVSCLSFEQNSTAVTTTTIVKDLVSDSPSVARVSVSEVAVSLVSQTDRWVAVTSLLIDRRYWYKETRQEITVAGRGGPLLKGAQINAAISVCTWKATSAPEMF